MFSPLDVPTRQYWEWTIFPPLGTQKKKPNPPPSAFLKRFLSGPHSSMSADSRGSASKKEKVLNPQQRGRGEEKGEGQQGRRQIDFSRGGAHQSPPPPIDLSKQPRGHEAISTPGFEFALSFPFSAQNALLKERQHFSRAKAFLLFFRVFNVGHFLQTVTRPAQ